MAIAITNPAGDDSPVKVDHQVLLEATASANWSASINGGSATTFATSTSVAIYAAPSSVVNNDGSGNSGTDVITITADAGHGDTDTRTLIVVEGESAVECTTRSGEISGDVVDLLADPQHNPDQGGQDRSVQSSDAFLGEGEEGKEPCKLIPLVDGSPEKCECEAEAPAAAIGSIDAASGVLGGPDPMFCPAVREVSKPKIKASPDGNLQVCTSCMVLPTRGWPLDLGVTFSNAPDGLGSGERPAGCKRSFGWQMRLIQDTAGNVAIYREHRKVEGWKTTDGGSTLVAPKGSYGTLTKAGGKFDRTSKSAVYFDFDSAGRLQTIKDRSSNGNIIYIYLY